MLLTIRYYAQAADWLNCREETLALDPAASQAAAVRRAFQLLAEKHGPRFAERVYNPQDDRLQPGLFVLLNGCHLARLKGLDTPLKDQDLLAVLPVIEAG